VNLRRFGTWMWKQKGVEVGELRLPFSTCLFGRSRTKVLWQGVFLQLEIDIVGPH
jgi:hypothetical protein